MGISPDRYDVILADTIRHSADTMFRIQQTAETGNAYMPKTLKWTLGFSKNRFCKRLTLDFICKKTPLNVAVCYFLDQFTPHNL